MSTNDKIPLRDLNLTDRFLFDEVSDIPEAHQLMLSIILNENITLLKLNQSEKEFRISPLAKSVRIDVFAVSEDQKVYISEMQKHYKNDLAKRSRYYGGLVDSSLLEVGALNYNELNDSCIIMITPFDLFGYGKYMYTFRPRCEEVPECTLEDGTVRIFLNTKGHNDADVSGELIEFLHYIEQTSTVDVNRLESERIRKLHEYVSQVKASEEIGVKYMQRWEELEYAKQDARQEGLQEGRQEGLQEAQEEAIKERYRYNQLISHLINDNRHNTLKELVENPDMLETLYKEYHL